VIVRLNGTFGAGKTTTARVHQHTGTPGHPADDPGRGVRAGDLRRAGRTRDPVARFVLHATLVETGGKTPSELAREIVTTLER
jgi:dephospho-CoA kinase